MVNDLAWSIASPPLMDESTYGWLFPSETWYKNQLDLQTDWLLALDQEPDALYHHVKQKQPNNPNAYFQTLIDFWLNNQSAFKVLAKNYPISIHGKLLKTLDFVLQETTRKQRYFHWDVSLRTYLSRSNLSDWSDWFNLAGDKRLDKTISEMVHKQSQLRTAGETESCFSQFSDSEFDAKIIIKGLFFYPYTDFAKQQLNAPYQTAKNHLTGWWVQQPEMENLFIDDTKKWCFSNYFLSLAPLLNPLANEPLSSRQMQAKALSHFNNNSTPLFLYELCKQQEWSECSRGIIVSSNWPKPIEHHKNASKIIPYKDLI